MSGVSKLPSMMRQVTLLKYVPKYTSYSSLELLSECFSIEEVPVPNPGPGQALVRVSNASINPSDLMHCMGMYGIKETPPCSVGFEGSGTVVGMGPSEHKFTSEGSRVGVLGKDIWSEYVLADFKSLINLPKSATFEQSACSLINPLTALSFVDIAQTEGHKTFVHTAAASALGQMVIREALSCDIEPICVVRKPEQEELCKKAGASIVLNSTDPDFLKQLRSVCKAHKCRLGFDAVGGSKTGEILQAMYFNGTLLVYGGLSNELVCSAGLGDLIFAGKTLRGFWLTPYMTKRGQSNPKVIQEWFAKIGSSLDSNLATNVQEVYDLEDVEKALKHYTENMSKGKVLLKTGL
eukprot:Nk52_evm52s296 gene=Nk52_evmTU52s296